jgi:alkane 1-monooxygenase
MESRDLKYLISYIIPISGIISLWYGGIYVWGTGILAYIIIPVLDGFLPVSNKNLEIELKDKKRINKYFDAILLINLPLVYFALWMFLANVGNASSNLECVGMILTTAIVLTTSGINVAHELGHKNETYNKICSQLLLLPSLYMHFFIEHNRGHHLNVATALDPATSRKNEIFYTFWFRSVIGQWKNAWKLEHNRIGSYWSPRSLMLQFIFVQLLFLGFIYFLFGGMVLGMFVIAAVTSFTQLELINYIEHYGLNRNKLPNGRYEKVGPQHSWNSNHELGRIILYELTRHSDHHYKSAKKFQILDHHDDSPQLPYGYPASILMSLIPMLWFKVMNPRVPA